MSEPEITASIKAVMVGSGEVGKTSVIRRFDGQPFSIETRATVGVGITTKKVPLEDGTAAMLMLLDTAGQERFRAIAASTYRGAQAIVGVYSITDAASLAELEEHVRAATEGALPGADVIVIGNKLDLRHEAQVTVEEGERAAARMGAMGHCLTSAMTSEGIADSLESVVRRAAERVRAEASTSGDSSDAADDAVVLDEPHDELHREPEARSRVKAQSRCCA